MFNHIPVLLKETIDGLNVDKDKVYVDATLGGGGHSEEILKILDKGKGFLIGIDQDDDAIRETSERLNKYIDNKKLIVIKNNFENISEILDDLNIKKVDGILFDLGVSSYQLDEGDRGFSYNKDAVLDMRMDKDNPLTCEMLVNTYQESELKNIIENYGEEKFAKNIAKKIVLYRNTKKIETTIELAEIIKEAYPASARRKSSGHPARKTFQALRIEVNGELEKLEKTIDVMFDRLEKGGRLSIITFHSLEDRIVKKSFNSYCSGCTCPPEFPVCVCGKKPAGKLCFKVKEPSKEELENNHRSRSAKLRAVEKL